MSTETIEKSHDFVVGELGGRYTRYQAQEAVPEGQKIILPNDLTQMTKEELEEIYATLAGVSPKTFKNPTIAMENVVYQITKMPISGAISTAALVQPAPIRNAAPGSPALAPKAAGRKYERKTPNRFTLLLNKDSEKAIKELAPQARTCVGILVDFAKETGRLEFTEEELKSRFDSSVDRLNTQQSPWRILQYYRSKLIGANLLRVN